MTKAKFVIEEEELQPEEAGLDSGRISEVESEETDLAKEIPELAAKPVAMEAPVNEKLEPLKVIEAALFLSNKPLMNAELALIAKTSVKEADRLVHVLQKQYESTDGALELIMENGSAALQVKPKFLAPVAKLSKEVELSRKATRILALVANKGQLLQSQLKHYFRGEIYAYVTELKERGYVTAEKKGLTRLLKPTKKFFESFQLSA